MIRRTVSRVRLKTGEWLDLKEYMDQREAGLGSSGTQVWVDELECLDEYGTISAKEWRRLGEIVKGYIGSMSQESVVELFRESNEKMKEIDAEYKGMVVAMQEMKNKPVAGRPPERLEMVMAWMRSYFGKGGDRGGGGGNGGRGWLRANDVLRAGVKAGFSESLIRKAAVRLGVTKQGGEWSLR